MNRARGYFRFAKVSLLGAIAVIIAIAATRPATPTAPADAEPLFPTELALERRIPEVWIDQLPLEDAARILSKQVGVPIVVDPALRPSPSPYWPRLATVRLRNASLKNIAKEIGCDLEFAATPEHFVLSKVGKKDDSHDVVRAYDVSDLFRRPMPQPLIDSLDFSRPYSPPGNLRNFSRETLTEYLWDNVASPGWTKTGYVAFMNDQLIVRQTLDGHVVLRRHLAELRSGRVDGFSVWSDDRDVLRWHSHLKGWYSISGMKGVLQLHRDVAAFDVESVPVHLALWMLFRQADMPFSFEPWPEWPEERLWAGHLTTVSVRNKSLRDACRQVLAGMKKHGPPPTAAGDPIFHLNGEVLELRLAGIVMGGGDAISR